MAKMLIRILRAGHGVPTTVGRTLSCIYITGSDTNSLPRHTRATSVLWSQLVTPIGP